MTTDELQALRDLLPVDHWPWEGATIRIVEIRWLLDNLRHNGSEVTP